MTGTAGRRPNVLLVMVDQLSAGWLPAYGHAVTRAPHLTALAREGVVFERAYCASPLCGPSRSAMLTGRLPSATGVFDNADRQVDQMLERVALSASYADRYPDQLSGGERQRVAIARALVSGPSVLICDEVTSALDVSVQAAIVELLAELQRDLGLAMLFVTHNLPLVRSIAGRVAVMSTGRVVELGPVEQVIHAPTDEYTRRLLADTPSLETATA